MYLEYWGFTKLPFENVPDPDVFYLSKTHKEALTHLIYVAERRKGCAILSGEIGCGKTTLSRVLINKLSEETHDIGFIINPNLESDEFLQEVMYQLGVHDLPNTKEECLIVLRGRIIENSKMNKETLLIVDEAQLLTEPSYEILRLMLNFKLNNRSLMTIILIGQPELRLIIESIKQLDQKISIKYHLTHFNYKDTSQYIIFRLNNAGRKENIFSRKAIEKIYKHSKGVPREINNLCDISLLVGFSTNKDSINSKLVDSVISDSRLS